MRSAHGLPIALVALLLTGACAYGGATGYAPTGYPAGYDSGMGSGLFTQPGDLFGGQNVSSVAVFEAPLAPFGQWVDSRFGRAFRPDAPQGWRPYVNGRWGEDRLWVSDDPWGWATDHYGRWGFDQQVGWVWVPGTEWAPSWTAWREDPQANVAGWAPIPPNVNYSLAMGFGTGWGFDNFNSWYAPSWVWVPRSFAFQPGFGGRVLPWNYGASYWGGSRWQYQPGYGGRPYVGGPGIRQPGNWQGRPVRGGLWQGRSPRGGQWQGRVPQGDQWQDRVPQEGQWQGRPAEGGQWQGRPQRGGQWQGRPRDGAGAAGLPRTGGNGEVRTVGDRPQRGAGASGGPRGGNYVARPDGAPARAAPVANYAAPRAEPQARSMPQRSGRAQADSQYERPN